MSIEQAGQAGTTQTRLRFDPAWEPQGILRAIPCIHRPAYRTPLGVLIEGDCLDVLRFVESETIDTVFADPPFNLGKEYGERFHDRLGHDEYVAWCRSWIDECVRTLKPGGSFFLYNIPKWNVLLGAHLNACGLAFRHWIAIDIKFGLPIPGRLYPSHYSLLYYSKGKPKTFRSIRTPIKTCRHCGGEVKDYGGHRDAMNPKGVNLTDVWDDIPPVRHWKFKSKRRKANQLSTKLLNRVIQLSTRPGDVVLDPFGGSGTTFYVCENTGRHWIGVELHNCDVIIERLESGEIEQHRHEDHIEG